MQKVNKNRIRSLATAGLLSFSVLAQTAHAESTQSTYYTYADVIAVEPSYSRLTVSEPVEQCYDVPSPSSRSYYGGVRYDHRGPYASRRYDDYGRHHHGHPGATILGGIIGGLIGNQFGGGNGRKALTIAGTAIGASVASRAARHPVRPAYDYRPPAPARRCTTTTETREHTVLDGYDVIYLYHGQEFTKRVSEHPGDRIRIRVDVEPV